MCSGGGGLVGTLADYLRFCEMLRGGGALGEARLLGKTVAMMASNWMGGDPRHGPADFQRNAL